MIAHFLSCILLGTAITLLVVVTISVMARLRQRTLEDVIVAIRPVQLDRLAVLLDPANEWRLKDRARQEGISFATAQAHSPDPGNCVAHVAQRFRACRVEQEGRRTR